ncbi:MAG: substrate binding domain-containing protein, partial [Alphaproteobacteria bacterium]
RAVRILDEVDEAHLAVASEEAEPSGVLRVAMPTAVGREIVALALPGFLARYPAVRVVLSMSDLLVDMVDARIDVAIRVGRQKDSALIARKIGESRRVVCASPAYLEQAGTPKRPADLLEHNCLTFRDHPGHNVWTFRGPDGIEAIRVTGNMFVKSADALAAGAAGGLGLVLLPDWNIGVELRAGRLLPLLDGYDVEPPSSPIYAVYPPSPHLPAKVRVFIDFLTQRLRGGPDRRGSAGAPPAT